MRISISGTAYELLQLDDASCLESLGLSPIDGTKSSYEISVPKLAQLQREAFMWGEDSPEAIYRAAGRALGKRITKMLAKVAQDCGTRVVLAGAYPPKHTLAMLSHSFDKTTGTVLCGNVKVTSLADEYAHDVNAKPTCQFCAHRDRRFTVEGK